MAPDVYLDGSQDHGPDRDGEKGSGRDFCHTAALGAHVGGANPKVVQRMLGHASAAMTLDLFESDLDAVAENVANMWSHR